MNAHTGTYIFSLYFNLVYTLNNSSLNDPIEMDWIMFTLILSNNGSGHFEQKYSFKSE